jgi:hypothetical protein
VDGGDRSGSCIDFTPLNQDSDEKALFSSFLGAIRENAISPMQICKLALKNKPISQGNFFLD